VQLLHTDVVWFHMQSVWLSCQHVRFVFSVAQGTGAPAATAAMRFAKMAMDGIFGEGGDFLQL